MLAPSPVVKKTAKTALADHWIQAIVVSVVLVFAFFIGELTATLVSIVADMIGYIIFLFLFVVFAIYPLFLGALSWFRRLLWGQNDSVLLIFKYFSSKADYKRALHFVAILTTKLAVVAAVLFSPCVIVLILSSEWFFAMFNLSLPVWTSNLWTLNSFWIIIATFALVFVALKYYLAAFLFVSNDDLHPAEAVNMSTIISKRTGGDFMGLTLSFCGWILLSFLVAPLVFTIPYFITSYGVHCRYAITAYNNDVDRFNAKDTPYYSVDEV